MVDPQNLKAVIFDLDGVITSTAKIHAQAWKEMFDTFLVDYSHQRGISYKPMDPVEDYRLYVDGRPRYEGAQNFLKSRNIELPYGTLDDLPGIHTVCGLANSKNLIYLSLLQNQGAQAYEDTIDTIKKLRRSHKKTAVISASKNCRLVLERTHITDLFDVIVDGVDSQNFHLKGKPEPDIFLFAAKQLQISPPEAGIVEDATAGVKAGKTGGFGYVIGVSRNHHADLLYQNGADIVVSSLCDIVEHLISGTHVPEQIPSALQEFDKIESYFKSKSIVLLLDYDGTLTPIVSRPEEAQLSNEMRTALRSISEKIPTAVISGRNLNDVKQLVGLENLFFAGSHGFEIEGPKNLHFEMDKAVAVLPQIDKVQDELNTRLTEIKGVIIDRKKYAVAVHYRLVDESNLQIVWDLINRIAPKYNQLEVTNGKKVFEFRPRMNWNKGKALSWIVNCVSGDGRNVFPIYIGDDITDEDAFSEVKNWGLGILVGNHGEKSYADFRVQDTDGVLKFIQKLTNAL